MDTVATSVNDLRKKVSAVGGHNQKMRERMKQEQALVRVAQFKQKKVLEQSMKKITKQFTDNGIPANMVKWMSAALQVVEIDQDGLQFQSSALLHDGDWAVQIWPHSSVSMLSSQDHFMQNYCVHT